MAAEYTAIKEHSKQGTFQPSPNLGPSQLAAKADAELGLWKAVPTRLVSFSHKTSRKFRCDALPAPGAARASP
jgi:hypothetical protein